METTTQTNLELSKNFDPADHPATFSPGRVYRYHWQRRVLSQSRFDRRVLGIFLNPSTADESKADPTVTRWMNFAKAWGFGIAEVCNLFAFRGTDPKDMKRAPEPVGPVNDWWIAFRATAVDMVVVAWGTHGVHLNRDKEVWQMLERLAIPAYCFGVTQHGHPKHPLYLASDTPLQEYTGPQER